MTTKAITARGARAKALGRHGEDLAAAWLERRGYRILGRNVRTRLGEIDIVAEHGAWVVIVEVKTRRSEETGSPLEAITPAKARRLRRLAEAYMIDSGLDQGRDVRIDCIGILAGRAPGKERIDHVENAV